MPKPIFISSLTELAQKLSISRATLHDLQKRPGAPQVTPKGHDLNAWVAFASERVQKLKEDSGGLVPTTLREKKTAKEIEILEVRLAVMRGDLADIRMATNVLARIFGKHKAEAYQSARACAVKVQGKGADEIGRAISEILDRIFQGVQDGIDQAESEIQHENLTQLT